MPSEPGRGVTNPTVQDLSLNLGLKIPQCRDAARFELLRQTIKLLLKRESSAAVSAGYPCSQHRRSRLCCVHVVGNIRLQEQGENLPRSSAVKLHLENECEGKCHIPP